MTLGDHIRVARLDRRLTQAQAAEQLGVTEGTVVNWELGHWGPDLRSIPTVLTWLGFDPRPRGETLPEQIRWLREGRGLSQQELARLLGADPSSVSLWEQGQTQPIRKYREVLARMIEGEQSAIQE